MRNAKLKKILESIAYDRGHAYGMEEVDNIFRNLAYELREIDAMLPFDMPPKFKFGDKVRYDDAALYGVILEYTDTPTITEKLGHRYLVDFGEYKTIVPEHDLSLDKERT